MAYDGVIIQNNTQPVYIQNFNYIKIYRFLYCILPDILLTLYWLMDDLFLNNHE